MWRLGLRNSEDKSGAETKTETHIRTARAGNSNVLTAMNLFTDFQTPSKDKRTVRFGGEKCTVHYDRYADGSPVILLRCADGSAMTTATVHVDTSPALAAQGEVAIKSWSENNGMLIILEAAGIVKRTDRIFALPRAFADIAELTPEVEEHA